MRAHTAYSQAMPRRLRPGTRGLACLLALQTACATLEPTVPPTGHQSLDAPLAVVASAQPTEIGAASFVRSKGEGALYQGGSAFAHCLGSFSHGSCSGDVCGAVLLAGLGICGIAGLVGGIAGAASAPSATLERDAALINVKVASEEAQRALRDETRAQAIASGAKLVTLAPEVEAAAAKARDYRQLAALGADQVLEVALTRIQPSGEGVDPEVRVSLVADVRLVRTQDNAELFAARYLHQGAAQTFADWTSNNGKPLEAALRDGIGALGRHIYDNVFLLYPYPDRQPHSSGTLSAAFGLAPISPATRGQLTGDRIIGGWFEWTQVESNQPTLRWQTFPRPGDVTAAPQDMNRAKSVSYDLVIARERGMSPGETVYRRERLTASSHHLDTPLSPDTRYFWSVRARFELDGRERLTEWSSTHFIAREQWTAPSQWSFRFRTP